MKSDRKSLKSSLLLYGITDSSMVGNRTLKAMVEEAILGGATMIQLREKNISLDEYISIAREIKELTDKYNIPLIINDQVEVALACGAAGVHVGQSDMDASIVRAKIGPNKILGVSAKTVKEAVLAEKAGADYLGVGAVFPTSTKRDAVLVSLETLKNICNSVSIPVVAIGGINEENIIKLKSSGIAGISVVSAIFAQEDAKKAAERLRKEIERIIR
ncbi:MAG TPA: thiamine phosphate synthase [Tissierellia bacterium]|nr:thiamine phosphate synthase [Tissierellia bacterium]